MNYDEYVKFAYGRWPKSVVATGGGAAVTGNIAAVMAQGTADAIFAAGCVAEETSGGYAPAEDDVATLNVLLPMALSSVTCKTGKLQVFFFPDDDATRWDNLV